MYRRTAHFLTLFAVAAHTVLGCCWHHGHAAENAHPAIAATGAAQDAAADADEFCCTANAPEALPDPMCCLCGDCSGNRSTPCEDSLCAYVAPRPADAINLGLASHPDGTLPDATATTVAARMLLRVSEHLDRLSHGPARCALLEVWRL